MYAIRISEGMSLKEEIEKVVYSEKFSAATIISAVGSLSRVVICMAGASSDKQDIRTYDGKYEIVSLIGNIGQDRSHIHISFSDKNGDVIGGHLKEGAIVHTTAELVFAVEGSISFGEIEDSKTGFKELKVTHHGN